MSYNHLLTENQSVIYYTNNNSIALFRIGVKSEVVLVNNFTLVLWAKTIL